MNGRSLHCNQRPFIGFFFFIGQPSSIFPHYSSFLAIWRETRPFITRTPLFSLPVRVNGLLALISARNSVNVLPTYFTLSTHLPKQHTKLLNVYKTEVCFFGSAVCWGLVNCEISLIWFQIFLLAPTGWIDEYQADRRGPCRQCIATAAADAAIFVFFLSSVAKLLPRRLCGGDFIGQLQQWNRSHFCSRYLF